MLSWILFLFFVCASYILWLFIAVTSIYCIILCVALSIPYFSDSDNSRIPQPRATYFIVMPPNRRILILSPLQVLAYMIIYPPCLRLDSARIFVCSPLQTSCIRPCPVHTSRLNLLFPYRKSPFAAYPPSLLRFVSPSLFTRPFLCSPPFHCSTYQAYKKRRSLPCKQRPSWVYP